jgi:hypothetical protein
MNGGCPMGQLLFLLIMAGMRSTQMAKKSNVHPDYYKTAGREPVGQSTVHEDHKREFASAAKAESDGTRHGKGGGTTRGLTRPVKRKTASRRARQARAIRD